MLARDPARGKARLGPAIDVIHGDITRKESLSPAIRGAAHIIFTAGCRSGHPAGEARVKATEHQGVVNTLDVARDAEFTGRLLYMTSSGVLTPSPFATLLNLYKGNTLRWRRRAEGEIRASGIEYSIIRAGVLLNRAGGRRSIQVTQQPLPLSFRYRIARADVAEAFIAALDHPRAAGASFEIAWAPGNERRSWPQLLGRLEPDRCVVFFYGLFMDQDLLRAKGLEPQGAILASVDGLELRIGQRAALIKAHGGRVHGMVLSLTRAELSRLYSEPGVRMYVPQPVTARLANGDILPVQCYNLPEPPLWSDWNPEYAAKLRAVAERVGLPAEYVASIR